MAQSPMIDQAMARSLDLLNRFAGSDLARRLGLLEPAQRLVREGSRRGFQAAEAAAKAFQPLVKLVKPVRAERAGGDLSVFDLRPTEEQAMMQETVRRFATTVMRAEARAADDRGAPPEGFLERAAELGLLQLAIPEALGGYGGERDPVADVLVLEELASGDMALALVVAAPLAVVRALVQCGTASQQSRYLAAFAEDGALPAAMAVVEPRPLFDPYRLATRALRTEGGWTLNGVKSLVPLGGSARFWLVAAAAEGLGPRLFIVERGAPGLAVRPEPAMGLRGADLARIELTDVVVAEDAMLGHGDDDGLSWAELVDGARIAWAAMAVGASRAVLEHVVPYANERQAFGEPISHRQSVAFMIADIAIELDGMRLLTWRAASRASAGVEHRREAALARIQAVEKGMKIGTDGIQLLGGAGFIKEHPVELWYRHLRAVGVMDGGLLV
ncbi:MAG: acyl-CoA dehydrogenase family protein [Deltaproteobacteria bacterium]|nr:acyl-CoA dehydrogenase family protein [Deltaproteobacteria bacterium]